MKKTVLLLLTSLLPFMSAYSDPIDIHRTLGQNPIRPRTNVPTVTADVENNIITIDISQYVGFVALKINNEEGDYFVDDIFYIDGHTSFDANISYFVKDSYTIIIELEDGSSYEGCFDITM